MKKLLVILFNVGILLGFLFVLSIKAPFEDPKVQPSPFAPRAKMESLPPLSFQVFETGYSEAPEAIVFRGGSLLNTYRYTHSAVLIYHPKGTVILDSGLGATFPEQLDSMPFLARLFIENAFHLSLPLKDHQNFPALDPERDFFLVSHAHWDHLSGMLDFDLPIRLLKKEQDFALAQGGQFQHGVLPYQIQEIKDRFQPIVLENKPYENFSRSLDLFGDGSLVLVSLSGHTPGSLGLFANLATGQRLLFVGDALWSVDPQGKPQARTWLAERLSDFNPMEARLVRLRLAELIRHSNEISLIPLHDAKALALVTRSD